MTRETKIGLLVGLCFIIVIGILLSDHLSTNEAPQPAQLNMVANAVRSATNIPAAAEQPVVTAPLVPVSATPHEQIPSHADPKPGSAVIEISGSQTSAGQPKAKVVEAMDTKNVTGPTVDGVTRVPQDNKSIVSGGNLLVDLGKKQGMEMEVVDGKAKPTTNPSNDKVSINAKEYKAEDGDTVSKMARMFYKSSSKSNCDLIINANASLKANPHKIIVGKTYLIPTIEKPGAKLSESALNSITPTTKPATIAQTEPKPTSTSYRSYTVKDNDNLYKIAMKELGTSNWQQIQDLNKDVLKGGDKVKPGMTLKIPAKTVAIAH